MTKHLLTLDLSRPLYDEIVQSAQEGGITVADWFRLSFALLKVAHKAKKAGKSVGFVTDPALLDEEITGIP